MLSREGLAAGLEVLRAWELEPVVAPHCLERLGHLAGSDEHRLSDLHGALSDPSVRAVLAARGGYGVTRLLHRLDWELVRRDPKVIVGFSDISALLNAAWVHAGLVTVHGPSVIGLGRQDGTAAIHLRRLLTSTDPLGRLPDPAGTVRTVRGGTAEGRLLGGNLALLTALIGTADLPDLRGALLLLEDVNEVPYRLDRMLTHLRRAGVLEEVAGVIVGTLTGCLPSVDRPSLTADEVVDDVLGGLGVPCVAGLPVGHIDGQLAVPIGAWARLDAGAGEVEVLEPAVA